ncbi:MAG: hypothetical protein QUS33_03060 [Dehalococcoidia bacterium]|nr:hypothetical protein [Dehalococcoidia bacterium]
MSGTDVLLFVVATALVAAIATLFAFQITATRLERRMRGRSRVLEEPVPGRRCLSTIGLSNECERNTTPSDRSHSRQPANSGDPHANDLEDMELATSLPLTGGEDRLNSLQTIRSRSASLKNDLEPSQSAEPEPLTTAASPPPKRVQKRPASEVEQEQGTPAPRAKSRPERPPTGDTALPSIGPNAEPGAPTVAPKTSGSKRARRAGPQAERPETTRRPNQASADTLADVPSLDLLANLQPGDIASLGQDANMPEMLLGLDEPDPGTQSLGNDLSNIDGGGLPTTPKTSPKSRR